MLFSFFSSRRRHTIYIGDWSSDVCSSDLIRLAICPAAFSVNQPARICRALGSLGFTSRFEDKAQPRAELVPSQIGRASCRERVDNEGGDGECITKEERVDCGARH